MRKNSGSAALGTRVKGTTKIVGIFGDPVTYTFSPRMHNFAFAQLNLDYVYVPFLVKEKDLKSAVDALRGLNIVGVNVTIPHKQTILPYMDELSPLAEEIGAVNTVINREGKLIGHNTDAHGFLTSLKEDGQLNPKNKRAVILGAGGTAHAMSVALIESGVKKIAILNRSLPRAENLAKHLHKYSTQTEIVPSKLSDYSLTEELRHTDMLLNATPTGFDTSLISVPPERILTPNLFVFDAVYAKATPLLVSAKKAGAPHLGGLGMLIRQGALSFSLWTGLEPPVDLMRKALEEK